MIDFINAVKNCLEERGKTIDDLFTDYVVSKILSINTNKEIPALKL